MLHYQFEVLSIIILWVFIRFIFQTLKCKHYKRWRNIPRWSPTWCSMKIWLQLNPPSPSLQPDPCWLPANKKCDLINSNWSNTDGPSVSILFCYAANTLVCTFSNGQFFGRMYKKLMFHHHYPIHMNKKYSRMQNNNGANVHT